MDKITVGIATIPSRIESLKETIKSLQNQTIKPDIIYIYLNNFKSIPNFLKGENLVIFVNKKDLGDAGKFYMIGQVRGYYFSIDDDIIYPHDYIEKMISGIEKYRRKKITTYHGSILKFPLSNYYHNRQLLNFKRELLTDTKVHLPGTGVTAFHTDTIKLSIDDFPLPNMGDVFLGVKAQKMGVGITVLRHRKNWIRPIENTTVNSIFQIHVRDEKKIKQAADVINSIHEWKIY